MNNITPNYYNGFAPRDGPPAYPETHKSFFGGWVPSLGNTGNVLRDVMGKNHGTFNETTLPVWDTSGIPPSSSVVLSWTTDDPNSYIELGDILDFQFLYTERWSVISSFSIADNADERGIIGKWYTAAFQQFNSRITKLSAPEAVQVRVNSSLVITSSDLIALDTWYTTCITNDGTGSAGGLALYIFDEWGSLLETSTATHNSNTSNLTEPVRLWGFRNNDEWNGLAGPVYFYTDVLPMAVMTTIAKDNLAPLRLEPRVIGLATEAAPPAGGPPAGSLALLGVGV